MNRTKFVTRTVVIRSEQQRNTVTILAHQVPDGVEVVFREPDKARKPDQNALMWSGPLKDIERQAWVSGRQFSDVVWHEHFKAEYLPEEFDPELCKEGYRKWAIGPKGDRKLVGSTTELTVKGFAQYLEQVYAEGANMGVEFSANPADMRRAA